MRLILFAYNCQKSLRNAKKKSAIFKRTPTICRTFECSHTGEVQALSKYMTQHSISATAES